MISRPRFPRVAFAVDFRVPLAFLGCCFLSLASMEAAEPANPALSKLGSSVTFYASFDHESTDADLSPVAVQDVGREKEKNRFLDGVYGKAFLPEGQRVPQYSFNAAGVSFGVPGSVMIWVSPREWERGSPEEYVSFVRIGAANGLLMLAKSNQQGRTDRIYAFVKSGKDERGNSMGNGDTSQWQDGDWHLLALNWGTDWIALSVDGNEFVQLSVPDLPTFGELQWLMIGSGEVKPRKMAYDEVMLLDRPLTQEEVSEFYQAGGTR